MLQCRSVCLCRAAECRSPELHCWQSRGMQLPSTRALATASWHCLCVSLPLLLSPFPAGRTARGLWFFLQTQVSSVLSSMALAGQCRGRQEEKVLLCPAGP